MITYLQARENKSKKRGIPTKLTAYHEAGHAVMAYILRIRLSEVTIILGEDYLGRFSHGTGRNIHPEWESDHKTRVELERRAMQILAGNVAEHLLTGKRHRAGSYDDYHKVVNLLSYLAGPEEIVKYVEWLWYRTKGMLGVDHWWLAIQRLAEELLKHHHLKSKRIREIIRLAVDEDFERKVRSKR